MIHLFGKVYAVADWQYDIQLPRFTISSRVGSPVDHQLKQLYGLPISNSYLNVSSWDRAVGQDGTYKNDLDLLNAIYYKSLKEKKIKLYLDNDSWNIFIVKWLKIMFPNMSRDMAWKVFNLFSTHMKYRCTAMGFMWYNSPEYSVDYKRNLVSEWQYLTEKLFIELYDKTNLDLPIADYSKFKDKIKNDISMEWMVANYLFDRSFEQPIGFKMFNVVKNVINSEAKFVRIFYVNSVMEPWLQEYLGFKWDPSIPIADCIGENETLQYIFDESVDLFNEDFIRKYPGVNFGALKAKLDSVEGAPDRMLPEEVMNIVVNKVTLSKADVDKLLEVDRNNWRCLFDYDDRTKVNVLLLKWLYKQDSDTLAMFKI